MPPKPSHAKPGRSSTFAFDQRDDINCNLGKGEEGDEREDNEAKIEAGREEGGMMRTVTLPKELKKLDVKAIENSGRVLNCSCVRTRFCSDCSAVVTLLGQSVRTRFCSARFLLGRCHSARVECSDRILLGQNSAGTGFISDRILLGRCHSAQAKCSDEILFDQNSARPLSLCSGRVFGRDSVWTEFCSAVVTLLWQNVLTGFCSARILLGRCHSECSDEILFGQNSARPLSLCSGRVFGRDFVRPEFCSAVVTLLGQSVRKGFCLASLSLCSGRVFGRDSAQPNSWYPPRVSFSIDVFERDLKIFKFLYSSACDTCGVDEPLRFPRNGYLRLVCSSPWFARTSNYGTKFEMGVYEEQVKSGYRLPLHLFAICFFEHYRMAPGQLVPNGWRKLAGLIYLVQTSGYKPDATDFMRVFFEICFVKGIANCPGWCDDLGMPDSQVGEQHLLHGILPRDKEFFQNQTHETFACSFSQAVYKMYASRSEMLSHFEMARQVAAEEAQQKRDAIKEAQEATHCAKELSKREEDYLAKIVTLEKRLERVKRKAAEEVTKARDQAIRDFLDGNAGDEWLKKRTEDGLEIYELGFTKANEMFGERFPEIPLEDFVLPAVASPSREIAMPSEVGDAVASHPPGEGSSGDAPEP
ncbi:hypothetical protein RJ639_036264 [Escallonia herrerae]|uniref:Transposase (putative) gypsy type domain-containing protein n=1 Tax=Escallonia herrerae TaxID=1293975 RepID=A0AA88WR16_9ASTE|nr:hypothetical protein RJ639_036264 [Escallonia herrerae]